MKYKLCLLGIPCLLLPFVIKAQILSLQGKITSTDGSPIPHASIIAKSNNKIATISNDKGNFTLNNFPIGESIVITEINHLPTELLITSTTPVTIVLRKKTGDLDEVIVQGYGTTTRRLTTGSIGRVTSADIEKQPVSNFIGALEGRIPGVSVSQTSGVPGAIFKIEIRGRSAIDNSLSGNDPLFIIDGVPFEQGNQPFTQQTSSANTPTQTSQGGLGALATINPADIESIEVLKDADATAIYGSRGANGVLLITTKKGKGSTSQWTGNLYSGWSNITRSMQMLNTGQYLSMRHEAFANDNIVPDITKAPDLFAWDTTRYTDFKKLLIGNTAKTVDGNLSLAGGNSATRFVLAAGYHRETNVYSNQLADNRISFRFNIHHQVSTNLSTDFTTLYSNDKNNLLQNDLTQYINLPPNMRLYDATGKLSWSEGGVTLQDGLLNPMALFQRTNTSSSSNIIGNLLINYQPVKGLNIKASAGYNKFTSDEIALTPQSSLPPGLLGTSAWGNSNSSNWIVEPQINYNRKFGIGKLDVLFGATWQSRSYKTGSTLAGNYVNDLLLNSLAAAGSILSITNNSTNYRYNAFFGRLNYNINDKYIVNLTGRRDGSSRFGPGKRFSNFGAAGLAWIFSNEKGFLQQFPFISFAKLRGSYGITGNDQVGEYKFLDLWASSGNYQAIPGLQPTSLFNPNYEWEINNKLEAALELELFQSRIYISAAWFRNRCSNQLVYYTTPFTTGFSSVIRNFPALVQNTGWELSVNTKNIVSKNLNWTTSLSLTIPQNRLLAFPGLSSSSYANSLEIGKSLNTYWGYHYLGIDPLKGVYVFEDSDHDGSFPSDGDRLSRGTTDPIFYGGLANSISYKKFEFSFFLDYRKQTGRNYLSTISAYQPGSSWNQPSFVLQRWRQNNQNTSIQQYTATAGTEAYYAAAYLSQSDGVFTDASFIRIKNVSLSYNIASLLPGKWHMNNCRLYLNAQNLVTITGYKGSDPETQNSYVLPPLRTIVGGVQFNF